MTCEPVIKPPTNDVAHDFGEFGVEDVKLFLTTYQNSQPGSNPGTVCPSLKVTSRAAGQPGRPCVDAYLAAEGRRPHHLRTSSRPGPPSTPPRTATSPPTRSSRMSAQPPTSSSRRKSRTARRSGLPDGWKDITVHCSNPGGGGLAPEPRGRPPTTRRRSRTGKARSPCWTAPDYKKTCPRKGQVSFEVSRDAPGAFELPHQLLQRRLLHRHRQRLQPGRRVQGAPAHMSSA